MFPLFRLIIFGIKPKTQGSERERRGKNIQKLIVIFSICLKNCKGPSSTTLWVKSSYFLTLSASHSMKQLQREASKKNEKTKCLKLNYFKTSFTQTQNAFHLHSAVSNSRQVSPVLHLVLYLTPLHYGSLALTCITEEKAFFSPTVSRAL